VYDDPEVYAKSSPITFIKKARTPTLILQGDRDAEVPAPQAYEFWHALKTLGVPTQLVIYANEGHGIRKPEHQRDIVERMVGWFDDHMSETAGNANEPASLAGPREPSPVLRQRARAGNRPTSPIRPSSGPLQ
jgi:Prolyl oligopeptidase family